MKLTYAVALLAFGLVLGLIPAIADGQQKKGAVAFIDAPPTAGAFQVSAYAYPGSGPGNRSGQGCYIINTKTGELWHSRYGGPFEKVSEKLQ